MKMMICSKGAGCFVIILSHIYSALSLYIDFTGCPFGPDIVWNIDWSNTERDTVNTQRCPGELDAVSGKECIDVIFIVKCIIINKTACH